MTVTACNTGVQCLNVFLLLIFFALVSEMGNPEQPGATPPSFGLSSRHFGP